MECMFSEEKKEVFEHSDQKMIFYRFDSESDNVFIWVHGWGRDHSAMLNIAGPFMSKCGHCFIDLPGFGGSEVPKSIWGISDYANFMAEFLRSFYPGKKLIWVSHSFGCRVGMRMSKMFPEIFVAMVLIAAPGVDVRSCVRKVFMALKVRFLKFMKALIRIPKVVEYAKTFVGSEDYRSLQAMRGILVNILNDDLLVDAKEIKVSTVLIYGQNDTVTRPQIGKIFSEYIENSRLILLEGLDHHTILTRGCYKVSECIKKFLVDNDL